MDFNNNNSNDYWNYSNQTTNSQFGDEAVYNPNPFVGATLTQESENSLFSKVFLWMGIGLGVSAICAFGGYMYFGGILGLAMIPLVVLELIVVLALSFGINKMNSVVATICFLLYSAINGLTLSSIFVAYELSSIYTTFGISAGIFFLAALYGKVTKKSLASWGTALFVGLIGLIVASIINIFIGNSMLDFGISLVGIVLFIGLTAYDVNRIRDMATNVGLVDSETIKKTAILGALQIYLDFVNIFLKVLRLMGKRK